MPFERVLLDESVLARLRRARAVLSPSDISRLPPDAVKLAESLRTEIQSGLAGPALVGDGHLCWRRARPRRPFDAVELDLTEWWRTK